MQIINQNGIVVEVSDLVSSKKKSVIHVLHVDDDPSILEISRQILMDMGSFDIDNSCCVDEAFEKLSTGQYDVVVSDYEMPQKSGLEFLKELREQNNQIPFILFTGKGREEVVIQALNLGANCYVNKQGTPETVYAELASSITQAVEHAKTQSLLQRSEERFSFLSAATFEGIGFSEEGKIVDTNNQLEKMLGYSHSELLGRKVIDLIAPESRDLIQDNIKFGTEDPYECLLVKKDGSVLPAEIRAKNMCYKGKLGRVCAIRDISERKKSETSLKETKDQLELQFEKMPVGCIFWDKNLKVISWNPAAENIFGYSAKDIIGKYPFGTIVPKEAQSELEKIWQRLLQGDETAHSVNDNFTKDGERITCSWTNTPLKRDDNSVIGVLSMVQDITENKKAEQVLIGSEANYRNLINGMNESTWVIDFNERFVDVNDAAVKILGYSKEELLSLGIMGIDKFLSQERAVSILNRVVSIGPQVFETVHTTKNGTQIPVEISSSLIIYQGTKAILSIARNITERKKAEEELKKNQVKMEIMNEKLNVVGRLTRHDVGNKLMVVKSNIYLLKKQIGDDPKLAKYLEGIDCAINQSDKMFEFSRFYEKIGVEQPSEIDVAQCFNQAATLLPNLGTIKVVNDCQGLYVTADSLLKQLFYNFLDNSLKYGEKVTQIRLSYTKEKDRVKLFYEDDGVGVPEANKLKLFHEGFSTGKSTGLGLFLIKKMVEVYGWTIAEEGEPGTGAKFTITIPKLGKNGKENYQIAK